MTSQPGYTITIHILPNISRSKDYQTMKFGQLIEQDKFFWKLVLDPSLFFENALYEKKPRKIV